jgi:hypothetical protein
VEYDFSEVEGLPVVAAAWENAIPVPVKVSARKPNVRVNLLIVLITSS